MNSGLTEQDRLAGIACARFDLSIGAAQEFFQSHVDSISMAALDMARNFQRGGRLIVFGEGADATDAQHVSVEFLHPVIVGKRALPAIALTNDVGSLTAANGIGFSTMLRTLGHASDIALGIGGSHSAPVRDALALAKSLGMLTIAIEPETADGAPSTEATHQFCFPGDDCLVAQEIGETLYHVFWELVHLFLEHGVGTEAGAGI